MNSNTQKAKKDQQSKKRGKRGLQQQQQRRPKNQSDAQARNPSKQTKHVTLPSQSEGLKISPQARAWVNMLTNPAGSEVVHAPANCSFLAAKARIVKSITVEATEENNGEFVTILRPSTVEPLIFASNPVRIPAAGNGYLQVASVGGVHYSAGTDTPGSPDANQFSITGDGIRKLGFMTMSAITDPVGVTYRCLNIDAAGALATVRVHNDGIRDVYVRMAAKTSGGNWVLEAPFRIKGDWSEDIWNANSASTFWTVLYCDKLGNVGSPDNNHRLHISVTVAAGNIPVPGAVGSVFRFVRDDLVEAGNVKNVRIAAASLLTTCMSSDVTSGGELVTANTEQAYVSKFGKTAELMAGLKALSETNRWISTHAKHGSYAFYVPDDSASYEPADYVSRDLQDNCLVVAGKLALGTVMRIEAVFVVEFYTSSALFDKQMTPSWDADFKLLLARVQRGQLVSANWDHNDMIKSVIRSILKGHKFLQDHHETIGTAMKLAASFA